MSEMYLSFDQDKFEKLEGITSNGEVVEVLSRYPTLLGRGNSNCIWRRKQYPNTLLISRCIEVDIDEYKDSSLAEREDTEDIEGHLTPVQLSLFPSKYLEIIGPPTILYRHDLLALKSLLEEAKIEEREKSLLFP